MVNKRDTSKQKRAKENRAQREARQARAVAASTPRPSRQAPAVSSRTASSKRAAASASASASNAGATKERAPRAPRPPRPGDIPVDIDALEGNWYRKRMQVPGGRQVITGAVLAIVLTPLTILQKFPEANTPEGQKVAYTQTLSEFYGWKAIPLLALPVLAALAALYFTLSPDRRRIWTLAAVVASVGIILGITYAFPVGFLVYAVMRSNKIEGPTPGSRAARSLAAREAKAEAAAADEGPAPDDE